MELRRTPQAELDPLGTKRELKGMCSGTRRDENRRRDEEGRSEERKECGVEPARVRVDRKECGTESPARVPRAVEGNVKRNKP